MTVCFGLIGVGRMGANLARHLAYTVDSANLVAIADPNQQQLSEMRPLFESVDTYSDYNKLLDRSDLDAVVIATPTNTHVEVVKAAAQAGKHIFTEKPLALTLERCDEAIAAVEANGVKLHVGFMRRFDPAYVAAKRKIDAGAIGNPVLFKSIGRDSWRPTIEFARRENSGGLMMDMGIHDFDLARWLMGSEVVRVYCEGGCLLYPELAEAGDIDNAIVNLKFANGAIGDIEISRSGIYGYDIRTEIVGTEGSLLIGKLQQTDILFLQPNNISHDTIPGFMERFADAFAAEIADFVTTIQEDRDTTVGADDARAATAVGIAATLSLEEERIVMISEIE
jgi:inositol 2-dehydrogenase